MNQEKPVKKSKVAPVVPVTAEAEAIIKDLIETPVETVEISTPGDLTVEETDVKIPDLSIAPDTVKTLADAFGIERADANPPTAWDVAMSGYPEPTVITIDE